MQVEAFALKYRAVLSVERSAYYAGVTDSNPVGNGSNEWLPSLLTSNMWDVNPSQWRFSEFNV